MTRINVVDPSTLSTKHLVAEFHEISRVFKLSHKWDSSPIPTQYTLGRGHVKFFYNRLEYIANRYIHLALEIRYRSHLAGKQSTCDIAKANELVGYYRQTIDPGKWGDYSPTPEAIQINLQRIRERS